MPSPNLVSHSVPIITLTLRAKRHCFCISRKKLPLKACLIICNECGDMLHWTMSSCCASLPFHTDTFICTCTQTHTRTSWQMDVGGKVTSQDEVVYDSKIDIGMYSDVDRKRFLVWLTSGGSRYREHKGMQERVCLLLKKIQRTCRDTKSDTLYFVWRRCQLRCQFQSASPEEGPSVPGRVFIVMGSWLGVSRCMWSLRVPCLCVGVGGRDA